MARVIGEDFASDVKINRMKLEEECEIQSSLYHIYGEQYADAKSTKERCTDTLSRTLAARELFFRRNPPMDIKPTEAVYSALVQDDADVNDAKEKLRIANEKFYHLDIALTAIEHKKAELDNMVKLAQIQYYGNGNTGSEVDARKGLLGKNKEEK